MCHIKQGFLLSVWFVAQAAFAGNPPPVADGTLQIAVNGIANNQGKVCIELFAQQEAAQFPERTPLLKQRIAAAGGTMTFTFDHLSPGRYAALVFHDENGNGKLDRNWIGIPSEPWGVSGKRPFAGPPSFADSVFSFDSAHRQIVIHME